jgi:single-strand DNA-binding protein
MAGEGVITVTGNIGNDVGIAFTSSNKAYLKFSIANTPRIKKDEVWQDGVTTWFNCTIWGRDAETAIEHLRKGTRVIVTGRFAGNTYTDKEGKERTSLDISVDNYGVVPRNTASAPVSTDTQNDPWA